MSDSKETNHEYYRTYWNDNMVEYLSNSAGNRWFDYLFGLMLDKLPPGAVRSAADIGCGVGIKTAAMARRFPEAEVMGYDFSVAGIEAARKHHTLPNLHFATEDITESTYDKKFDLITAFDVLEHIDDWKGLTKGLINVNTKYMILSSPVGRMRPYEVHVGHVRNFKRGEIEEFLASQGYKTVETFYAGFPFHSPLLRDLTNLFYKDYAGLPQAKMSWLARRMHDVWYFLFRYCCSKKRGDIFVGLFEKNGS